MIVDCAAYVDGVRSTIDPRGPSLRRYAGDLIDDLGVDDTPIAADRTGFVWLGLRMPTEPELDAVCDALDFEEVSAAKVLAPHARPVLTIDGPILQMVLRTARYDDASESIALGEMTLLVGPRSVVTVRHGQASPLAKLRASLEQHPDRLKLGPPAVLAAVIGRVIDDYSPALDGFENDVVEVEGDVFSDTRHQPVKRLYKLKREIRRFQVAIDALQDPLNRLIREIGPSLPDEVEADLLEAVDQLDRTLVRATSLSGLVDAALTASLTQITVQQNEDMRKISAWVAIAAVPTLIAGIYGMNFRRMPELDWELGYPLALAVIATVMIVLFRNFKKSGWL